MKKILSIFVLVLTLLFSTQALASLTFTSNAITGTSASSIDLGSGNDLSLQTTSNAPITTGTGLVTLGGSLNVAGNVGIGTTAPTQKLEVNGGIRLNTVTVKPTCDATTRGTMWYVAGGTGVEDSVEMCGKSDSDYYEWKEFLTFYYVGD